QPYLVLSDAATVAQHHPQSVPTRRSSDLRTEVAHMTSENAKKTVSLNDYIIDIGGAATKCSVTYEVVLENNTDFIIKRRTLKTEDRKSTRLNSSHVSISYAVFCLKQK